jgi:hypothetical protein
MRMVSKKGDINKTIEKIKSNYKRTLIHNKLKHVNKLYRKIKLKIYLKIKMAKKRRRRVNFNSCLKINRINRAKFI